MIDCIFEYWSALEADFQREYNINLVDSAYTLTWRRFIALVESLSSESVFRYQYEHDEDAPEQPKKQKKLLSDPEEMRRAILGR